MLLAGLRQQRLCTQVVVQQSRRRWSTSCGTQSCRTHMSKLGLARHEALIRGSVETSRSQAASSPGKHSCLRCLQVSGRRAVWRSLPALADLPVRLPACPAEYP